MIRINLLKPGVMVYDDSEPGGIIDIQKLGNSPKINPVLCEILWDRKEFIKYMKARKK